ncbi:MAG: SGNH/GDSL hydrolase family protein [Lentisphaeria bacterium]
MQIAVIGDSIVHGGRDAECGGWVARLKIREMRGNRGDHVFNLGLGGNTSRDLLARAAAEIQARRNHVTDVIFSAGTNDMYQDIPLPEFGANLAKLGEIAAGFGKRVYFMGLFLRTDFNMPEKTAAYDAVIREVCKSGRFTYIPTADLIGAADLDDGCHPNAAGHQKLCDRVAEFMPD